MMRILLVLLVVAAACRPERVVVPHSPGPHTQPEVRQDVSDTAPGGVVHNADGGNVDLATLWASKKVMLVFYMGHWCPHCQRQLGDLNEHQKEFTDLGVTIVAVSTDSPGDAAALKQKLGLTFDLYSDSELEVITKWGVADFGAQIAKPATFIIQPGGGISYRKISENQTDRPTVDELLNALKPQ